MPNSINGHSTNSYKTLDGIFTQLATFDQQPALLAVSKRQDSSQLREAFLAGQKRFGENYLQEALTKIEQLKDLNIEWHFIGPIQSNKCKAIAENFHWVQSLDRSTIADKLNKHCPNNKILQVCVQINIDQEKDKSGIHERELDEFCAHIQSLPKLQLRGLMLIPKATENISEQKQSFVKMHTHFKSLQKKYSHIDTLSMGMSGDYLIALEEGATMIRLGSALFGKRN